MIDLLKRLFADDAPSTLEDAHDPKAFAAAVLFFEAAASDGKVGPDEEERIRHLLTTHFSLSGDALETLCADAAERQRGAIEISSFTREAKAQFSYEDRTDLIEMLWQIAYADGVLDDFEANLMRRLSGLLYVEDRDSGAARKRALEKLKLS